MKRTRSPLFGIQVLDLSRLLPGFFASRLLKDLGATIIKVEAPGFIDLFRRWGYSIPSPYQKRLRLNLKREEGRKVLQKWVRQSTIILESFRPGVLRRLALDYPTLKRWRRDIILCSVTGYGQTGPKKGDPGHDLNYMAEAGLLGLNRDRHGFPVLPGFQIADLVGGALYAVVALLASLLRREKTGQGEHLDISMTDGARSLVDFYLKKGEAPFQLTGGLARYNIYETKDKKYLALGCLEPKFWKNFCEAIGHAAWAEGVERYEYIGRRRHGTLKKLFRSKTQEEWLAFFAGKEVCLSPVRGLAAI